MVHSLSLLRGTLKHKRKGADKVKSKSIVEQIADFAKQEKTSLLRLPVTLPNSYFNRHRNLFQKYCILRMITNNARAADVVIIITRQNESDDEKRNRSGSGAGRCCVGCGKNGYRNEIRSSPLVGALTILDSSRMRTFPA